MNRRVPITFNQYPCYENILLFATAKLRPENDFDENNDMQKYRIKNQFSVESFSGVLRPRETFFFHFYFPRMKTNKKG